MVFIGESSQNGRTFQVSELLLAQIFEAHGNLEIPHLKAPFHTDEKVSFTNYSSLVHFARQSTAALPINPETCNFFASRCKSAPSNASPQWLFWASVSIRDLNDVDLCLLNEAHPELHTISLINLQEWPQDSAVVFFLTISSPNNNDHAFDLWRGLFSVKQSHIMLVKQCHKLPVVWWLESHPFIIFGMDHDCHTCVASLVWRRLAVVGAFKRKSGKPFFAVKILLNVQKYPGNFRLEMLWKSLKLKPLFHPE